MAPLSEHAGHERTADDDADFDDGSFSSGSASPARHSGTNTATRPSSNFPPSSAASSKRGPVVARLTLLDVPDPISYDIHTGTTIIGRDEGADIIIPSTCVSSRHATLEISKSGLFHMIYDSSTNGTWYRRSRYGKEAPLRLKFSSLEGDETAIYQYQLVDGEIIKFADICARYDVLEPWRSDIGMGRLVSREPPEEIMQTAPQQTAARLVDDSQQQDQEDQQQPAVRRKPPVVPDASNNVAVVLDSHPVRRADDSVPVDIAPSNNALYLSAVPAPASDGDQHHPSSAREQVVAEEEPISAPKDDLDVAHGEVVSTTREAPVRSGAATPRLAAAAAAIEHAQVSQVPDQAGEQIETGAPAPAEQAEHDRSSPAPVDSPVKEKRRGAAKKAAQAATTAPASSSTGKGRGGRKKKETKVASDQEDVPMEDVVPAQVAPASPPAGQPPRPTLDEPDSSLPIKTRKKKRVETWSGDSDSDSGPAQMPAPVPAPQITVDSSDNEIEREQEQKPKAKGRAKQQKQKEKEKPEEQSVAASAAPSGDESDGPTTATKRKSTKAAKSGAVPSVNKRSSPRKQTKGKVSGPVAAPAVFDVPSSAPTDDIVAGQQGADDAAKEKPAKRQKKQATKAEPSPARRRDEDVVRPPNLDSLPKILFTGLDEDEGAAQAKIVDNLGGEVVEDWRACTHLVMDKKIKRTIKFLCALGKGKSIVGVDWLEACKKSGTFVDESKYVVRDNEFEKRMGFSLEESIKLAKTKPILQGWSFYNAAHNVKPAPQDMKEVIEAAGGQVLQEVPDENEEDKSKIVILGGDSDEAFCKQMTRNGFICCSNEFVLTGVLKQRLNPSEFPVGGTAGGKGVSPSKGSSKRKRSDD